MKKKHALHWKHFLKRICNCSICYLGFFTNEGSNADMSGRFGKILRQGLWKHMGICTGKGAAKC